MSRSLLKILGVSFGLAVTIGNTIGAGILRTPGDVAAALPNPVLFLGVWVIGACYALLGTNALAELGAMLPRSGAQYVYARYTFGDYAGFVVGWLDWISTSASSAAISIVIGESLVALIPQLRGEATHLAMATVALFTLLLLRGTKLGAHAQELTSLFKALALLAFVAACFIFPAHAGAIGPPPIPTTPAATTAPVVLGFVLAAQSVIYTYDGWNGPLYFAEELREPGREIPRSMFGGLLCIATIYLLMNIAYLHVLPVRAFAGSTLAAGAVAQAIFGARGELVVRAMVVVALPSAVNACLLMSSRVLYGISRDGLGPRAGTRINAGGTPTVALVASGLVAVAFLASGTFETVIAVAAFFFVANYTLSFAALFVLRRREPSAPRPWRAAGHPWTTGIVLLGSLGFLVGAVLEDTRNSLYALALVIISYPVFRIVRRVWRTAQVPVATTPS